MSKKSNPWIVVALVAATVYATNGFSMRCGNHLVNEGDRVEALVEYCGEPTSNSGSTVVYHHKDGVGMSYFIHVNTDGTIDNITFSRD